MNEPIEQHDAATRGSLHMIAIALAHLWLVNAWLRIKRLPSPSQYWVYTDQLNWGREILKGKRIHITIEIEDWEPGAHR